MAEYIVKRGDNLTKIARANGLTINDLLLLNPNIVNPNLILIGLKIVLPTVEETIPVITPGPVTRPAFGNPDETGAVVLKQPIPRAGAYADPKFKEDVARWMYAQTGNPFYAPFIPEIVTWGDDGGQLHVGNAYFGNLSDLAIYNYYLRHPGKGLTYYGLTILSPEEAIAIRNREKAAGTFDSDAIVKVNPLTGDILFQEDIDALQDLMNQFNTNRAAFQAGMNAATQALISDNINRTTGDAWQHVNMAGLGVPNLLTPSGLIGLIRSTITGDGNFFDNLLLGNSGVVSSEFARENPETAFWLNMGTDLAAGARAKGVKIRPKLFGKNASRFVSGYVGAESPYRPSVVEGASSPDVYGSRGAGTRWIGQGTTKGKGARTQGRTGYNTSGRNGAYTRVGSAVTPHAETSISTPRGRVRTTPAVPYAPWIEGILGYSQMPIGLHYTRNGMPTQTIYPVATSTPDYRYLEISVEDNPFEIWFDLQPKGTIQNYNGRPILIEGGDLWIDRVRRRRVATPEGYVVQDSTSYPTLYIPTGITLLPGGIVGNPTIDYDTNIFSNKKGGKLIKKKSYGNN